MAIRDDDLLDLANQLAAGSEEVEHRSGVSRAYYAAFHRCGAWHGALSTPGRAPATPGGMHHQLIEALVAPTVLGANAVRSKSLGYMLRALKHMRVKADYRLDESVDVHEAATAVENAKKILEKAV